MLNRFLITPFVLDRPSPELQALAQPGWVLNQPELPLGETQPRLAPIHQGIADFTAAALVDGKRPVSIAGDCCTAIGFLAGLQRGGMQPVLIWLDAHGDFNTWETTPSGFLGGMPLAMLVGRGEQTMPQAVGLQSLSEEDVILCDGRDLDPGERLALDGSQVVQCQELQDVLDCLPPERPVYMHFDTDILNPQDAPAMSYLAAGGPTAAELQDFFQALATSGRVAAVSMTTWTPRLDVDGKSQEVCMRLLRTLVD